MFVLPRLILTVLVKNQGVNFQNVIKAERSKMYVNNGFTMIDEKLLEESLPLIDKNFDCAHSTRVFGAFLVL